MNCKTKVYLIFLSSLCAPSFCFVACMYPLLFSCNVDLHPLASKIRRQRSVVARVFIQLIIG